MKAISTLERMSFGSFSGWVEDPKASFFRENMKKMFDVSIYGKCELVIIAFLSILCHCLATGGQKQETCSWLFGAASNDQLLQTPLFPSVFLRVFPTLFEFSMLFS